MADYGNAFDPTLGFYGSSSYGAPNYGQTQTFGAQQNNATIPFPSNTTPAPTAPTAPTPAPGAPTTNPNTFTPGPGFTNTAPTLPNLIPGQPPVSIANKQPDGAYPVQKGEWIIWKNGIPTLTLTDPHATPPAAPPGGGITNPAYYAPFTTPPPVFTKPPPFQLPTLEEAENQPGYKFGVQQGEQALLQSAAAKGLARTGGTLKGILDYGRNAATQNYGNVVAQNLGLYNTNVGTQFQQPFDNAFTTFIAQQNQFQQNQQNPFNKYLELLKLGQNVT